MPSPTVCVRVLRCQQAGAGGKEWLLRSAEHRAHLPWGDRDEIDFVSGERVAELLEVVAAIAATVDGARRTTNLEPDGEPQVGRRGL